MFPYIEIAPIEIGGVEISPFGILVVMAVAVGVKLAIMRGRRLGVEVDELKYFIVTICIFGLVGAHVLDVVFYYPYEIIERPWMLLDLSNGLSSFGGFISAVIGGVFWKYYGLRDWFKIGKDQFRLPVKRERPLSMLPFTDILCAVFPFSWVIGRMGCALVHDHLGISAPFGSWLSVASGSGPAKEFGFIILRYGSEPRYDLGLIEMFFAAFLSISFAATWRFGGAKGWYIVAGCLLYAPVRFFMDFWRETNLVTGDARYAGLTPAQWGCFLLFAFGAGLGVYLYRNSGDGRER